MPLKKDVFTGKKKLYTGKPNLSDKAVYNIAKFAPTALVAGAVGSTIKKETATQHTTIPTGWEGGD
ncbi:hypothetical protein H8D85_01545 [bacterium]|nr:hypothetical protein [bacterium]